MRTTPTPLKSQPLHNFSLPLLKWRKNQRNNHHCRKSFDSGRESSSTPLDHRFPASESDTVGSSLPSCSSTLPHMEKSQKHRTQTDSGSDVSAVKEDRSKFIIRISPGKKPELVLKSNPAVVLKDHEGKCEVEESISNPKNTIPSRIVYEDSNDIGKASKNAKSQEKLPSLPPVPLPEKRSLRLKGIAEAQNVNKEKRKLSMVVSREEIEADFCAIIGSKLAQRQAIKRGFEVWSDIGKASKNTESQEKLPSPPPVPLPEKRSLRLKAQKVNKEKQKLSMVVSREEIEKDFFAITGTKRGRRPAIKRKKSVQQELDLMCPGLRFGGMTLDSYKKKI